MKSNEFITEEVVKPYKFKAYNSTTKAGIQKLIKILTTNCSESLAMLQTPIWRGLNTHSAPYVHIRPQTGIRRSEVTSNHYTELLCNNPYYAGWPKRNSSLICSTSQKFAKEFGSYMYAIFPFNGTPIAVSPRNDIWNVFIDLPRLDDRYRFEHFNNFLKTKFNLPETYSNMEAFIKTPEFAKKLQAYNKRFDIENPLTAEQFLPYLHKCMAPTTLKMKLLPVSEFASLRANKKMGNKECWFSNDAIAVNSSIYLLLVDEITKGNQ